MSDILISNIEEIFTSDFPMVVKHTPCHRAHMRHPSRVISTYYLFGCFLHGLEILIPLTANDFKLYSNTVSPNCKTNKCGEIFKTGIPENPNYEFFTIILGSYVRICIPSHAFNGRIKNRSAKTFERLKLTLFEEAPCTTLYTNIDTATDGENYFARLTYLNNGVTHYTYRNINAPVAGVCVDTPVIDFDVVVLETTHDIILPEELQIHIQTNKILGTHYNDPRHAYKQRIVMKLLAFVNFIIMKQED